MSGFISISRDLASTTIITGPINAIVSFIATAASRPKVKLIIKRLYHVFLAFLNILRAMYFRAPELSAVATKLNMPIRKKITSKFIAAAYSSIGKRPRRIVRADANNIIAQTDKFRKRPLSKSAPMR